MPAAANTNADGIVALIGGQEAQLARGQLLLVQISDVGRGDGRPILRVETDGKECLRCPETNHAHDDGKLFHARSKILNYGGCALL